MKAYINFDNIFEDGKFQQLEGQSVIMGSTAPQQITPLVFQFFQPPVKILLRKMMHFELPRPLYGNF
jgi:hypothetical protein